MKKFLHLFILGLCAIFTLQLSAAVDPQTARIVARNFTIENSNFTNEMLENMSLIYTEYSGEEPLYYVFDIEQKGFVIVSACMITKPILAFSFDNEYKKNPTLDNWMQGYSKSILKHKQLKTETPSQNSAQWEHFMQENFEPRVAKTDAVGPLLTTTWNQNMFYNTYCPWDVQAGSYYDYRVPNGCVALACAMIMNYYRHPETGVGGASYVPSPYPRQRVVFSEHQYHWDAMTDEAEWYNGEVSKIIYHIGVACQMGYNYTGSGAHTEIAAQKMAAHFGYKQNFERIYPENYANGYEQTYIDMLKEELNYRRPILYSGYSPEGGHAFVLDGYRNDNYFHFNMGWGGSGNGYFLYDEITFNSNAMGITHLYPASNYPAQCVDFKRQTASTGYITNGSTNQPYQANPDCQWMIATPGASSYEFEFARIDIAENDVITIYNGPTMNDGIAGQFSGNIIPNEIEVNADSVLITFTSTAPSAKNEEHLGFLINYTTNSQPRDCAQNTSLTISINGRISDESPEGENYIPETSCTWMIAPKFITGFSINVPQFELGLGDFIDLYDATTTPPTLWKRYDVNTPPELGVQFFPYQKLKVTFVSDNFMQGEGFMLDYWAHLGIENHSGLQNVSYSPNPASDMVTIKFATEEAQQVMCKIVDMTGKVIISQLFNHNGGEFSESLNLSDVAAGMYIIHIETSKGNFSGKILIQ